MPAKLQTICTALFLAAFSGLGAASEEYAATDFTPAGWGSFFGEVFRSLDIIGFILLVVLVIIMGMCVDLFNHLRVGKLIPETLLADVQEEMANGEYEKALELCEKSNSLIGQVFAAALSKTDYSFERMEKAMYGEVEIQGLVWRQWIRQFRMLAAAGFLLGFAGALIETMRFVSDMVGRTNLVLALSSSFEMRTLVYGIFIALFIGTLMTIISLAVSTLAGSKLEKILLEAGRLGEELLDPFRPLPVLPEE